MSLVRRLLLLVVLPALGLVAGPPAQALSCVDPHSVAAGSETLFTGRIRDFRDERFLVAVQEIWRGEVPAEVWLATDGIGYWSDMRSFPSGTIPDGYSSETVFLFAPRKRTNYPLTVNVCTMWDTFTPWDTNLTALRPADPVVPAAAPRAEIPAPAKDSSGPDTGLVAGVGTGAVLAAIGSVVAWRRRRTD